MVLVFTLKITFLLTPVLLHLNSLLTTPCPNIHVMHRAFFTAARLDVLRLDPILERML